MVDRVKSYSTPSVVTLQVATCGVYRATLCVSAVFAVARCVRPSVRLSVTLVHCIQTIEDIVRLLSQASSPIILVFGPKSIPRESFQGAQNTRNGKILRFSTEIAVFFGNGTR